MLGVSLYLIYKLMKQSLIKNLLLLICFFLSLTIKAQITVKVNQAIVNNTSAYFNNAPIIIPNTTNNVDLYIEVYSAAGESPTSPAELRVYRSSTGSVGLGSEIMMTSQTVYFNTTYNSHFFYNINFNSGDFPPGGGIYIEYKKDSGLIYRSPLISVVKPSLAPITNNTVISNTTIYYGQSASLTGSIPSGGNGTFTYVWQKKLGNGSWGDYDSSLSPNFNTPALTTTTTYRRRVNSGSAPESYSNEVTVTVNNSLPITNNIISGNQTIDEGDAAAILTGTVPSGGSGAGSFKYSWQKKIANGIWEDISGATSLTYDPGILYETTSYRRIVRSGNAADNTSNEITINVIPAPLLTDNTISISNGIVTGSQPTGGTGNYVYKWTVYLENGELDLMELSLTTQSITIPNNIYNFANFSGTRIFRTVISGRQSSGSNNVLIQPATNIENNIIQINGIEIVGSTPQGGNGNYEYVWTLSGLEDQSYVLQNTEQNFILPIYIYDLMQSFPNLYITRTVKSANYSSISNSLLIPYLPEISNNTISLVGTSLIGSQPSGGYNNEYSYEWYGYNHFDGEIIGEVFQLDGNGQSNTIQIVPGLPTNYFRRVKSGPKVSSSNQVTYDLQSLRNESKRVANSDILKVYPNPTVGEVNFEIDVIGSTYTEIKVYNQSGKSNIVFKGNLNEGQIVKWNIPSDYPKGIYFYEISLENQEPKTGKIIYQ